MRRLLVLVGSSLAIAASALAAPAQAGSPVDARLYVANSFDDRIDVYDPTTGLYLGAIGAGEVNDPFGLTTAPNGDVLVADTGNNAIRRFTPNGTPTQTITGGIFIAPTDLVVDGGGNITATFGGSDAVVTFDPSGTFLSSYSTGPGSGPRAITIGSDGTHYVSLVGDGGNFNAPPGANDRVAVFVGGSHVRSIGAGGTAPGQFNNPVGVHFDGAGNLIVLEQGNNRFQRLTPFGSPIGQFGSIGGGNGQFLFPLGFTGTATELYVADSFNDRIQVLDLNGNFLRSFATNLPTDAALGVTAPTGSVLISGTKFEDVNGNKTQDAGENGLAGWTIYVDRDSDGVLDQGEPQVVTDANGGFAFTPAPPGTFRIREVAQPGWRQTTDPVDLTLDAGATADVKIGNFKDVKVTGTSFEDANRDGVRDAGETALEGERVYLDLNQDGARQDQEPSVVTGPGGVYALGGIGPGSGVMRVEPQLGWTSTTSPGLMIATSGLEVTQDLGVARLLNGRIVGVKFEDLNNNSALDDGEPRLGGWQIYIDLNDNAALDDGEPWQFVSDRPLPVGDVVFERLPPGDYVVREVPRAGWALMDAIRVTVSPNTTTNIQLPNSRHGSVDGTVFEDRDADGQRDPGEQGQTNWKAFLDLNRNGILDGQEPSATTGPDGVYHLGELPPSNGVMRVELQEGFEVTTPADPGTTITSGAQVTRDFGVRGTGRIVGVKFEDLNNNGRGDEGDDLLDDVQLFLDANGNGVLDPGEAGATTDAGQFEFEGLAPGTHRLAEVPRPGWQPLEAREITVSPGAPTVVEVPNFKLGTAKGFVYDDRNGDNARDAGEPGLPNWSVLLDRNDNGTFDAGEQLTATSSDGAYSFTGIGPGAAAVVVQKPSGWEGVNIFRFTPTSGGAVTHDFGFFQSLVISGLDAVALGPHDIKVTFTTSVAALAALGIPDRTWPEGTPPATNHVVVLSGLEPQTPYVMNVFVEGEDGQTATASATAETGAPGGFTPSLVVNPVTGVVGVTFAANPATLTTQLTGSQRFVAQAYRDLLVREIDPAGVGFWTSVLAGGTRTDVALGLQQTDEFRGAIVAGMYQTFLGRAGTPAEIASGASSLQTVSRQAFAAQLLGSAEYFTRAGGENAAWVTRLYHDVLHREPTTGEAGGSLGALSAGQTREAAALDVLTSREASTNAVREAYQRHLHRDASPGEVAFFVNRLSDERIERVTAALIGSSEFFDGLPASDAVVERAGTATIETGDGRAVAGPLGRTGASTFRVTGDLNYDAAGTFDLGVTVFDGANVVVGATTAEIRAELGVNLVPDATDPSKTELRVVGTSADDTIALDRPGGAAIRVVLNGVPAGVFSPTGRIVVDALAGNDTVNISSTISRRSWVYGGPGADAVNAASSGGNLLLGGEGNDRLTGGAGRDLLIGGNGVDVLGGSGGDDILVGGPTTLDGDTASLAAIMAEWSSSRSYAQKIDNLARFFGPTTVPNDGEADELRGGRARDWFIAASNDFTDVGSGEIVTLIP